MNHDEWVAQCARCYVGAGLHWIEAMACAALSWDYHRASGLDPVEAANEDLAHR